MILLFGEKRAKSDFIFALNKMCLAIQRFSLRSFETNLIYMLLFHVSLSKINIHIHDKYLIKFHKFCSILCVIKYFLQSFFASDY